MKDIKIRERYAQTTKKLEDTLVNEIYSLYWGLRVKLSTNPHAGAQLCVRVDAQGSNTLMDKMPRGCVWVCALYSIHACGNIYICLSLLAGAKWLLPPLAHIRDYN